jgi:hypothetical protein
MPGLKIQINVSEAQKAVADLRRDLKSLGAESTLTEKQVKGLEARLVKKMGADGAEKAVRNLTEALGLSGKEVERLRLQMGEQLTPLEKLQRGYAGLKANWMALSGAAIGVWMAFKKVQEYLDLGAAAMKSEAAYEAMTKSMGVNGQKILDESTKATRGLIDNSDLMQRSIFALTQDIDPDKLPKLFEAASVAAKMTGRDIGEVAETMIEAVGTDMPRGLKKMGMITKEQMDIVNRAFAMGITDIKLMDMVLANAAVNQARMAGSTVEAADNLKRFYVEVHQLKEELGKDGLTLFQKFFGLMQGGAGTFLLLAAAANKASYEMLKAAALREKNPELREILENQAAAAGARLKSTAEGAAELLGAGKRNVFGPEEKEEYTQATGVGGTGVRKSLRQAKLTAAEAAQKEQTDKARRELELREEMKLAAEVAKARLESNQTIAENKRKTEADIVSLVEMGRLRESQALSIEAEKKKEINDLYRKDAVAAIMAEADARAAAEKYFPRDYFVKSKMTELAMTMKVKDAEVENIKALAEKRREYEKLNDAQEDAQRRYQKSEETRKRGIEWRLQTLGYEQRARDAEIEHAQKMTAFGVRYGEIGPGAAVEAEYEAQKARLLSEQLRIKETIEKKDEAIKEWNDEYLDWLRERDGLERQLLQIEKDMENVGRQQTEAMREYVGGMLEGFAAGLRAYREQIGSEFQIWEQFGRDAAQSMQNSFSDLFFDVLTGKFTSFGDFMTNLGKAWGRNLADAMAKETTEFTMDLGKKLLSWGRGLFGGFGGGMDSTWGAGGDWTFARGAAFDRGRVIPFAAGTVVDRPTYFPMAGGNVGLMGEKKEEAIMPLARTKTGELGVKTAGQGATIHMPMTVIGMTKKMASEVQRAAEEAIERKVKEYM